MWIRGGAYIHINKYIYICIRFLKMYMYIAVANGRHDCLPALNIPRNRIGDPNEACRSAVLAGLKAGLGRFGALQTAFCRKRGREEERCTYLYGYTPI